MIPTGPGTRQRRSRNQRRKRTFLLWRKPDICTLGRHAGEGVRPVSGFRIQTIRTDRGHEFQTLFHWHVADLGMEHVYIKPRTPQLNGTAERSHRTDKDEFYQLLSYRDDVDLEKKLAAWERFYNFDRPHGAHKGKTPYEVLREKLS